jgi:plastocyanin
MTTTVEEERGPEPKRRGLGLLVTAVWAGFAIAAPIVIIYRQADDNGNGGGGGYGGGNGPPVVTMAQIKFDPETLAVTRGATVRFVNEDIAPHTVTQTGGPIDSGILNPGKTFELTVNDPFEYICTIHPSMKAKVVFKG